MNAIETNIKNIPKLLRAKALETTTKEEDAFLFNTTADLIDHLAKIREKAKQLVRESHIR